MTGGGRPSRQQGPTAWDTSQGRTRNLSVSGLRVRYTGPGEEEKDAANVRADAPVPSDCSLYYWEVEVVSQGHEGFIGIGFATSNSKQDRLPGWDEGSWGYHGDDGCAFQGKGVKYGPKFGTGDVIGVIWNKAERTVSYTKNGIDLGVAFRNVKDDRLFPTVGLRTPDEEVIANFGATPFRYDVDLIRQDATREARSRIQEVALPPGPKGENVLGELIFDYLTHSGYWGAADALARDAGAVWGAVSPTDVHEQQIREQVAAGVLGGQIREALRMAETLAPGVLAANPRVWFQLEVQAFIELVRAEDIAGAIQQSSILGNMVASEDTDKLLEVMPLLAYKDPAASPSGHWLDHRVREEAAAALNAAVLHHLGRRERSALETAYRQLRVVSRELSAKGDPAAALADLDGMLDGLGLPQ